MSSSLTDRAHDQDERRGRGWAAGVSRPHYWPCRHCGMVTDYHLLRDAQLRQAETLNRRDEHVVRAVTFKDWLRAYEWDTDPRRPADEQPGDVDDDDADDDWATAWAAHRPTGVDIATSTAGREADPVAVARAAVDAIPAPRAPVDGEPAHRPDWSTTATDADEADDGASFGIAS